eukprot:351491-Chlamydomonas_euryale.AAC.20
MESRAGAPDKQPQRRRWSERSREQRAQAPACAMQHSHADGRAVSLDAERCDVKHMCRNAGGRCQEQCRESANAGGCGSGSTGMRGRDVKSW